MTNQKTDQIFKRQEYHQSLMDKMSIEASSVETYRPEGDKDLYADKLEKKMKNLKFIIDDMTEKSKHLEKRIRSEFNKDRNKIENRYLEIKDRINSIRSTGNDAWKELGKGTSKAFGDFTDGIKKAVEKFK